LLSSIKAALLILYNTATCFPFGGRLEQGFDYWRVASHSIEAFCLMARIVSIAGSG